MAEIAKLSVGKVLEKLRGADEQKKTKMMQLEEKVKTAEEEIQRLKAATRRLKRGQRPGTTGRD
jgi:predicted ribonuclease toxin of YeeF-YezG toxin-antitoxin module